MHKYCTRIIHTNTNIYIPLEYAVISTPLSTHYTCSSSYSSAELQADANGMNIDKGICYCTSHNYGNRIKDVNMEMENNANMSLYTN